MTRYWIRPGANDLDGQAVYGTGDGSSYDNAFSGLNDSGINWNEEASEFVISGVHLVINSASNTTYWETITTAGNAARKTIIRGDASQLQSGAEDGVVWGGYLPDSVLWSVHDAPSNTYRMTIARGNVSSPVNAGLVIDTSDSGVTASIVDRQTSIANVISSGGWYAATGEPGDTLYVNIGTDPSNRVILPFWGRYLSIAGATQVIFHGLTYYATTIVTQPTSTVVGQEWRRCKVWYGRYGKTSLFELKDRNWDIVIDRCDIAWGGDGAVYGKTSAGVEDNLDDLRDARFTENYIHDIGVPGTIEQGTTGDSHGVGLQNCTNIFIAGNIFERTGPCIVSWCGASQFATARMRNVITRYNAISAVHDCGGGAWNPRGIEITDQQGIADCTGNVVEHNVIRGPFTGAGTSPTQPGCAIKTSSRGAANIVTLRHCHCEDVPVGLFGIGSTNFYMEWFNITVINPSYVFASISLLTPNINCDNNYYAGTPSNSDFIYAAAQTFAQWQGNGPTFDPNSTRV